LSARDFRLQDTVRENVLELMRALGAIERPLSLRGLAAQIARRHPTKRIDFKAVARWVRDVDPVEPDIVSLAIMSQLAGVDFMHFALGKRYASTDLASGATTVIEAGDDYRVPGVPRVPIIKESAREREITAKPSASKKSAGDGRKRR
jgi:hypothetical protein